MKGNSILVVDDDADVRGLVRELLERAGASVREASDGREALKAIFTAAPELIILDVAMPGLDGWQTLERVRDMTDVPVLMLTARDAELEKVRGLRAGADDYVTKPFGRQELLARVEALVRRAGAGATRSTSLGETYSDDYLTMDVANAEVKVGEHPVALTPLELRMLSAFVRNAGQVLSRDQLLDLVWGDSTGVATDQVKLYVGYLRRKLEGAPGAGPAPIETVRGFGYRYRRA